MGKYSEFQEMGGVGRGRGSVYFKYRSMQRPGEISGSPDYKEPQSMTFAFYLEVKDFCQG